MTDDTELDDPETAERTLAAWLGRMRESMEPLSAERDVTSVRGVEVLDSCRRERDSQLEERERSERRRKARERDEQGR
jgi:hypothetical protein